MEAFKVVEKAMKTKQFSKEGLSAAAKLDPKERAKAEACEFLSNMVDDLERQVEQLEAEHESLQATMRKGKIAAAKAERIAEIDHITERHKWHQSKLELMKRTLENDGIETEDVTRLEEDIKYYVNENADPNFAEDDAMYDDLNLIEEEEAFGLNNGDEKSQDTQSTPEETESTTTNKAKAQEPPATSTSGRRPSQQLKSPLPALATLHTPLTNTTTNVPPANMKPAAVPTRAPGETLKYASAAAAAANNLGIAPLPPPPGATPPSVSATPAVPVSAPSVSAMSSPVPTAVQPVVTQPPAAKVIPQAPAVKEVQTATLSKQSPALSHVSAVPSASHSNSFPPTPAAEVAKPATAASSIAAAAKSTTTAASQEIRGIDMSCNHKTRDILTAAVGGLPPPRNGVANGAHEANGDESIYHLPSGFQDLLQSFEITQSRASIHPSPSTYRMLDASWEKRPTASDFDAPKSQKPQYKYETPSYYPQTSLPIFENPALYSRIDTDTLFYIFYYKQGTYQQYLAAKALKEQSWRFHKQYQTWFQRHEEPKTITDEFEQGTYRFFDYESTW